MAGSLLGAAALNTAAADEKKPVADVVEHDYSQVVDLARELSKRDYQEDKLTLSGVFENLDYDHYRGIRFKQSADPIVSRSHDFGMDLLPPGSFYNERVQIYVVNDKKIAVELPFSVDALDFQSDLFHGAEASLTDDDAKGLGWSGFRLRFPINDDDTMDEFCVFQGASYFRAIARNTLYGLSARGLAINTGANEGEEFPRFSRFWIHQPHPGAHSIVVDALLESPSITGAYRFEIYPGADTLFNIKMALFPRKTLTNYGIAPLTSMYYFSPARRNHIDDYRNAVHDSNGLAMHTGTDLRLWRALSNPKSLQYSAFMDSGPKGFGFEQRARDFNDYQDVEARYEKRPSAWVKPLSIWSKGNVSLIEIPTDNEFNDNIVAFWQGDTPLEEGVTYHFAYQLVWSTSGTRFKKHAQIDSTRIGQSVNRDGVFTAVIDYQFTHRVNVEELHFSPQASKGRIIASHLLALPDNRVRASFDYEPERGKAAELSADLSKGHQSVSEKWLYRWTN